MGNWALWEDGEDKEQGPPVPGGPRGSGHIPAGTTLRCLLCACVCAWCGVRGSGCAWICLCCVCVCILLCGWVSLVFTESLASAKEENVGIHQVLDQTLLELNNL